MRRLACLAASVLAACSGPSPQPQPPAVAASAEFEVAADWPSYGRDLGGRRYSALKQINTGNVGDLRQAWSYPLDADANAAAETSPAVWEVTPLVVGGVLYTTATGRIVALKADTGAEIWRQSLEPGAAAPRRGLAYWPGERGQPARILCIVGRRLVALDAASGRKLPTFGVSGEVEMPVTFHSAPLLFEDRLIVGSTTGPGSVRAYDVRSGAQMWVFAAVPPGTESAAGAVRTTASFTLDADRALLYAAFASASADPRVDGQPENPLGSAVVALDARTGARRWQFQTVHHDVWGYDVAAPPNLTDIVAADGSHVPALALAAETGYVYLLNRVTGEPLLGMTETPVSKSEVPAEQSAATQPIPTKPVALARVAFAAEDLVTAQDTNDEHANFCRELRDASGGLQNLGPFTPFRFRAPNAPPRSTLVFPGAGGGMGWGGTAADPLLGFVYANVTNIGGLGWVEPNAEEAAAAEAGGAPRPDALPYRRGSVAGEPHQFAWNGAPGGVPWPCQKPPWGQLVAVNAASGEIAWSVPLGITADLAEARQHTGRPNVGGPIVTAGGLVFIGATDDRKLRAFDSRTGDELWVTPLPQPGQAVPVTYMGRNGKQYVAIVAGGGAMADSASGAGRPGLVAFALP
ncbi:MAG: PQQ-binding-like beta-propeller repeat protein [Gammaproteobacteria bacterium]